MTFTPSQVQVNTSARPIWGGSPAQSILIYNPDAANTVYLGGTGGISVGASNTLPLGPGQSVSLDGSQAIYACAPAGTAATVVIPGGAAFFLGLTQAQGKLALASMTSPGFIAGSAGWALFKDGSAEFNNVTIRGGLVVNGTQVFYSTATPTAGAMVISIGKASVTDPAGNVTIPGVVTYSGTTAATQFWNGAVRAWSAPSQAGPWTAQPAQLSFASERITAPAGSVLYNPVLTSDGGTTPVVVGPPGIAALEPGQVLSAGTPEVWHALAPVNGWTATLLRYKMLAENNLMIQGTVNPAAMTSTTIATLPAGYRPVTANQDWPVAAHTATPPTQGVFMRLDTAGNLTALNATTTSGQFGINMIVPLD